MKWSVWEVSLFVNPRFWGPPPSIYEHPCLNPPFSGFAVAFEQMQFRKALKYLVREIDLDAVWIEDSSIEFIRQGFAPPGWLIAEFQPAHIGFLQTYSEKKEHPKFDLLQNLTASHYTGGA